MGKATQFFNRLQGVWENRVNERWQDRSGWNIISYPVAGRAGPREFVMRFDRMRETIKFSKLGGLARNIGAMGKIEYWRAMPYEISIVSPEGESIHHEMGHFLLEVQENGETPDPLRGNIIRQASIPHAHTAMTTGELRRGMLADAIAERNRPFYSAKPTAPDQQAQDLIDNAFAAMQERVQTLGGPNLTRPLEWLRDTVADDPVDEDWVFEFHRVSNTSQTTSGHRLLHPVRVGNLLSDFWIASRVKCGRTIDMLAYAQTVNLHFRGTDWPHVALNTLIKQS